MPENPVLEQLEVPVDDTSLKAAAYSSAFGQTGYCLGYIEYPHDAPLPHNEEEMIAKAYEWLGVDRDNNEATARAISYGGHDGLEISRVIEGEDGSRLHNRTRWFLIGQRGIIAGVTGYNAPIDEQGAKRFLDSLRIDEEE